MKTFLKKLLLFAVLFFLLDKALLLLMGYTSTLEVDKRLEMAINGEMNKDIIVVGSSRGARNINAAHIEKVTGHKAYNMSYPGSDVEFHDFLVQTIVKFNKKPKLIVLTVDAGHPGQFETNSSIKFRLDRLYPLVKYDYVVDELIKRDEKNELLSKLFVLHRLNKSNFDIRPKHFSVLDTIKDNGSMPVTFQDKKEDWKFPVPKQHDAASEVPAKREAFLNIIKTCRENGIELLVVFSPNLMPYNDSFEARIKQLAGNNVHYMVYDKANPVYKDNTYYFDKEHLIAKGANVFTSEISSYINTNKSSLNLNQ